MTQHMTMDQLIAARDREASAEVERHLTGCAACRTELERLDQRVAALRALPARRPPRDRWLVVRERVQAERQRARWARTGWGALAMAAGLALAVGIRGLDLAGPAADSRPAARDASGQQATELATLVAQSHELETALQEYRPEGRIVSGRTAAIIAELEDRIALVDAGIARAARDERAQPELVNLWRDRVQLMDALVSTHVTRASYVGF